MNNLEQAYINGFCKAAEAYGYDPEALLSLNKEAAPVAAVKGVVKGVQGVKGVKGAIMKALRKLKTPALVAGTAAGAGLAGYGLGHEKGRDKGNTDAQSLIDAGRPQMFHY